MHGDEEETEGTTGPSQAESGNAKSIDHNDEERLMMTMMTVTRTTMATTMDDDYHDHDDHHRQVHAWAYEWMVACISTNKELCRLHVLGF